MVRTYVLDTCVLLADPQSLLRFDEHEVVLPLVVVEELDEASIYASVAPKEYRPSQTRRS